MANTYYIITSNAKGDAASPFTGDTARVEQVTEAELQKIFQDSGQIQDAFGTFDNYMNYVVESQDWVKSAQWMNEEVTYDPTSAEFLYENREDVRYTPGQREQIQQKIESDLYHAKMAAWYNWLGEGKDLMDKYGLSNTIYNDDGDQFRWTGSGYQKTIKVDDHADFGDYFKVVLQTVVVGGLTAGLGQTAVGSQLSSFFTNLGLSSSAASAAASSVLSTGANALLTGNFDLKQLIGSAIGAGLGTEFAGLAELSGAAGSAFASSTASVIEQAIVNGELDLGAVLKSGLLGGGAEIGKDFIASLLDPEDKFDFGGLLSKDSSLYAYLNGTDETVGLISEIRGAFDEFTTKYITGGQWWEATGGNYKNLTEISPGQWEATYWDGSTKRLSMVDLIKQGFSTGFFGGFEPTTGENAIWDFLTKNLDFIPDDWYDTLYDWLTTNSTSGSYTTDNGTTITTQTTGTGDGGDEGETSADFDCSSVNRIQTAGATEAFQCGPCIEGYQADEFGECVDVLVDDTETGVCPEGQVYNEITGKCSSELFFEEGQPCNTADGQQGVYDSEGKCYVPADTTGTGGDEGGDTGAQKGDECDLEDGTKGQINEAGECVAVATTTTPTKKPGEECDLEDGTKGKIDESGACVSVATTTSTRTDLEELCSQPRPEAGDFRRSTWDKYCGTTTTTTTTTSGTTPTETDCSLAECDSPRPDGEAGVLWDKCCTATTTTTTTEPDCQLVECESPRPEGELGALWDSCCTSTTTTVATTGTDTTGGTGGGATIGGRAGGAFSPFMQTFEYEQPTPVAIQQSAPVDYVADTKSKLDQAILRLAKRSSLFGDIV